MSQLHIDRDFKANPEELWNVLTDFEARSIPDLAIKIIEKGDPDKNNAGLIREIKMNGNTFREKILLVKPCETLEYELISGAPVHDFYGTVFIYPSKKYTTLRWVVTFRPNFPFPEWLIKRRINKALNFVLDKIESGLRK